MIQLDRHIEILLLSNDCVIIPSFGGFMAHYVEARTDVRDNAILPPMRTVGFNPKLTLNDSLLAQSYVEVYDISYPDALARIADEVRELRQHLENDGEYTLNDIGVLRLNGMGQYEFEPCSAGILTPALYGLSYYSLKTVSELERDAAPTETPLIIAPTAGVPPIANGEPADHEKSEPAKTIGIWRAIAAACVSAVVFMLIPAPLSNNQQVIMSNVDTHLLHRIMPRDVTTGEAHVERAVRNAGRQLALQKAEPAPETPQQTGYTIVLAARITKKNATDYAARLRQQGMAEAEALMLPRGAKVVYGHYATQGEAQQALARLTHTEQFADAWVMKY